MIRTAVTCNRADCLALYLEPVANPDARPGLDGEPTRAEDVLDFDQLVELAGWEVTGTAHACPACVAGRGPVLERGECPTCTGSTVDLPAGATCHYCRTVTPHADDLDDALWDGRGIEITGDGAKPGGDDWS
ncbi:hypothetical protein [Streptomyces sp. NPDC058677]|uniref:hypothetical protein n=1 Tax=Streptomyces sp. NPDC058677 TaxID=3346594 RepID=UPI00365425C4